jgi:hypothetical protein
VQIAGWPWRYATVASVIGTPGRRGRARRAAESARRLDKLRRNRYPTRAPASARRDATRAGGPNGRRPEMTLPLVISNVAAKP